MSHFYASIDGQAQTQATRRGSKKSGISGHIRGWDSGVQVYGGVNCDGQDVFDINVTSGSNGHKSDIPIARIINGEIELFTDRNGMEV